MTYEEQLNLWVSGKSVHGDEQCCPDFSCCRPELLAPKEVREVFAAANEKVRMRMLMEFLGKAFATDRVYIAGLETSRREAAQE